MCLDELLTMPTSPQSRPITLHTHEVRAILAGRQTI